MILRKVTEDERLAMTVTERCRLMAYVMKTVATPETFNWNIAGKSQYKSCDTIGCVAGWCSISFASWHHQNDAAQEMGRVLGLTEREARALYVRGYNIPSIMHDTQEAARQLEALAEKYEGR